MKILKIGSTLIFDWGELGVEYMSNEQRRQLDRLGWPTIPQLTCTWPGHVLPISFLFFSRCVSRSQPRLLQPPPSLPPATLSIRSCVVIPLRWPAWPKIT